MSKEKSFWEKWFCHCSGRDKEHAYTGERDDATEREDGDYYHVKVTEES